MRQRLTPTSRDGELLRRVKLFSSSVAVAAAIVGCIALCTGVAPAWAIKPSLKYATTPLSEGFSYDSLNIPTANRERLTAWLLKPSKLDSSQVIIFAGPDAGNMGYQLPIAEDLVKNLGVEVLLFDYRGFGTSDSIHIDTDILALPAFAYDLDSVVAYVRARIQPDSTKIVLYGRSMGASLAITVASEFHGVGGVIAESPYVSQRAIVQYYNRLRRSEGSNRVIRYVSTPLLEPLRMIHNLACPFLLMHGALEKAISSVEICELFRDCSSSNKSLWIVGNADHMQIPSVQTGAYLSDVYYFLRSSDAQ